VGSKLFDVDRETSRLDKASKSFFCLFNTKELRLIAGQHIYFTSGNSETET
jgi:hypothetical protein